MMNSAQQSLRPISRSLFSALRTRAPTLRCPTQQVHRLTTAQSNRLRHASLPSLREQLDLRDGSLLPCALPYHLPSPHKNATATATTATKTRGTALARDLIVLEYFSSDRVFPSYTTGWLLDTPSKQPILVTCCHTLQEVSQSVYCGSVLALSQLKPGVPRRCRAPLQTPKAASVSIDTTQTKK